MVSYNCHCSANATPQKKEINHSNVARAHILIEDAELRLTSERVVAFPCQGNT